ncbi:hypothetical protein ILUMI_14404 [Ignelater luminosus]|uniref:PiggyBac transposable element-derived protein domain-containing protein n=1 Tax=Ignelater luminosus TaxID=2038154 RepID=A0A8K0CSJ0_IGNLU|nr:hypothetical protein ILUMI_14404 [Ignelater luminosus]
MGTPDQCRRWDKTVKEYVNISRAGVIRHYNDNMEGVDKMEFLITIYRTIMRYLKWTLRLFIHAIDLAFTNAWFGYRSKALALSVPTEKILDLLHFPAHAAEARILGNKQNPAKRGRPSVTPLYRLSTSKG